MPTRRRRTAEESRQLILEAAEDLLREGGNHAIRLREIARRTGMTDAGIAHHFGTRDQLLEQLLKHGGHRLRTAVRKAIDNWDRHNTSTASIAEALAAVYADGYTELALALHAAGWRDNNAGLLDDVVEALHDRAKPGHTKQDVRLAVAALHQAIALEPAFGPEFRRSAGISARNANSSNGQLRWWITTIDRMLDSSGQPQT